MRTVVTARQARSLAEGHPWVRSEGLAEGRRGMKSGDLVSLVDGQGRDLGTALAAPGEPLPLRVWSRDGEGLSRAALLERAGTAWGRRARVRASGDTDAYRLVHGEADGLPGIFVDLWANWIVLEQQTAGWDPWLEGLLDGLERLARPSGILLRRRVPDARGSVGEGAVERVRGRTPPKEVEVRESGLRYRVRLADAKPGLFLDERENRSWLAPQCAGKRVLNAFAFTGAFSVAAAKAGALWVTSLDLSAPVLERLKENLKLNGIDPKGHPAVKGEARSTLLAWAKEGKRFDVVILDPPAYATSKGGRWQAERDYPALAREACGVLAPGGLLAAAITMQEVSAERFERMLQEGIARAGRRVASLTRRGLPEDFPTLPGFPEGSYLKFVGLRIA